MRLSHKIARSLCMAVLTSCAAPILAVTAPLATADTSCPDIEVVFARGTGDEPGVGFVGRAFIDALRSKVGGRSVGEYGVNYPAGYDFANSANAGANDTRAHVQDMAANCPGTKLVLGGMSQGAGVIDLVTMGPVNLKNYAAVPMAPNVADHIAAVAVFGNPLRKKSGGGPLTDLSPVYGARTIDMCAQDDLFCFPGGLSLAAHMSYAQNGMADQAANFVAGRL